MANKGVAALRQFTLGKGKSGGRNAQGRITVFHRGGGAKRLLRRIDLKRSVSGVGIVERLEYDPNRSSKIALVRWVEGAAAAPPRHRRELDAAMDQELASLRQKVLGSATATCDGGRFAFASLPGKVGRGRAGNVSWAALSSSAAKAAEGEGGLVRLPRMAVAGSKPAFFASRVRSEDGGGEVPLGEIREWRPDRDIWAHRIKRRAAISWQSIRRHSTLGIVGDARRGGAKPKVDRGLGAILSLAESSHQSSEHLVTGSRAPLC